jgi:hypothetical protein
MKFFIGRDEDTMEVLVAGQGTKQGTTPSAGSGLTLGELAVEEQLQRWAERVDEYRELRARVAELEVHY